MSKGEGHFGGVMPALDFLLSASKSDVHDISGLAVAMGPGSFTGLRVGLSAAKGLCHSLEVPIIGISSLGALASQIPYSAFPVTPVLDSRKGEFFTARFTRSDEHEFIRIEEDLCLKLEDFPALCKEPTIFIGNNFSSQGPAIKKALGPTALLAPACCWNLKASAVGSLALKRFHAHDFDDPEGLNPLYLRPPDIRSNPSLITTDG
jgi:tRNA threonylcarbamoyladenosine biosynthesis protein TsaB